LREDERPLLHEFFNRYTKAEEIIFPWELKIISLLKFLK
jgi:hypothetical protein